MFRSEEIPLGVRLAIVGSTKFADPYGDMLAEWLIKRALVLFEPEVVISGGAPGVDRMAEAIAMRFGFRTHICPPARPQWQPYGYKARNLRMAKTCTHLIAIRCSQSKTYGSGWTADKAESLGKHVYRKVV